jgi:hypothetical protein
MPDEEDEAAFNRSIDEPGLTELDNPIPMHWDPSVRSTDDKDGFAAKDNEDFERTKLFLLLSANPSVRSTASSDLRSRADWSLRVAARRRFGCLTHGPGCGRLQLREQSDH